MPGPGDDYWYGPYVSGALVDATPETATAVAAVFACVRVLSESLAQLPLHLMRDDGTRRQRAVDDPLYAILHDQPNERQSSFEWRETMQAHLALRGNAYSLIVLDPAGRTEQLVPLHPDRMSVFRLDQEGASRPGQFRLGFLYRDLNNVQYRLTQDEVFYLRGISYDGITGVSPITACRRAIELSMQAEYHGLMWWKNAAKPGGVLKHPSTLDDEAYKRLKKSWREAHTAQDLYTVAILEDGTDFQPIGISNQDSEWLENRRFQLTEICRIFRVPPPMIASAIEHGNTYANVEQSDLNFVKHTMLPWIVRWEQAIKMSLLDDPQLYATFVLEGLLRADMKTRSDFYTAMFGMGVYTQNDILTLENRDSFDGGDRRFIGTQFIPIDSAGQKVSATAAPAAIAVEQSTGESLAAWTRDVAERLANAEIRLAETETARHPDQDVYTCVMTAYDGRHRQYAFRALQPIASHLKAESLIAGVVSEMADSMAAGLLSDSLENVLAEMKLGRQETLITIITKGLSDAA
jgi:HK97 family phage portal protein